MGVGPVDSDEVIATPQKIYVGGVSEDLRLTQVSCGSYHSMGLGMDGEVWAWGRGASGMLGNGIANTDRPAPFPISYLMELNLRVKQIACGSQFNLILTEDGLVYSWGKNDSGKRKEEGWWWRRRWRPILTTRLK